MSRRHQRHDPRLSMSTMEDIEISPLFFATRQLIEWVRTMCLLAILARPSLSFFSLDDTLPHTRAQISIVDNNASNGSIRRIDSTMIVLASALMIC
jgi:hypothetical protein